MQFSHSRVDCHVQCPRKFQYRYVDKLKLLPDDAPDNALYLGTALHTGIETGIDEAIQQYYSNYPVIDDRHINEAIKLEVMIDKARKMLPDGYHEVKIDDEHFQGFIDLLVPVGSEGGVDLYDMYDFKYSNNTSNYLESGQLHEYKYFFEKTNPLCRIRNMYFLMVPKSKCKRYNNEDLMSYRKRLLQDLKTLVPELVPIKYDPYKVIDFLLNTKSAMEDESFEKKEGFLCKYCEYKEYCQKGEDFMLLPENKRRTIDAAAKKVIWIYGAPFSGKTTFANQFPDPLMLNTDGNCKFVDAPYIHIKDEVTKTGRMTERKMAWETFKEVIEELELKQNDFKTIVVDLLEDYYEFCRVYVRKQKGWEHESDDTFRAYDMIRGEFLNTLKRLMALDYENIVLISHLDSTKDITKKGGDKLTSIRPNINEKIANKVAGMVDIVARAIADNDEYALSFKRNEVIFGGGRLKFEVDEIPLDYSAFCKLYGAKAGVVSHENMEQVQTPSHVQKSDFEEQNEPIEVTETIKADDAPVETTRRRKRRTE